MGGSVTTSTGLAIRPDAIISDEDAELALKNLDAAVEGWTGATFDLAMAIADAKATKCWRLNTEFMDKMNALRADPDRDVGFPVVYHQHGRRRPDDEDVQPPTLNYLASYFSFRRYQFLSGSRIDQLARAGITYELLDRGAELLGGEVSATDRRAHLPQNEWQLRPLTKLAGLMPSRDHDGRLVHQVDSDGNPILPDTLAENAANIWTQAVREANDDLSQAPAKFREIATDSDYEPIQTVYRPLSREERRANEAAVWDQTIARMNRDLTWLMRTNFAGARKQVAHLQQMLEREATHHD